MSIRTAFVYTDYVIINPESHKDAQKARDRLIERYGTDRLSVNDEGDEVPQFLLWTDNPKDDSVFIESLFDDLQVDVLTNF